MDKPKVGDNITLTSQLSAMLGIDTLKVIAVYDDLEEDWGTNGEHAWAMAEADPTKKAKWYAVGTEDGKDEWSVCSFEVAE